MTELFFKETIPNTQDLGISKNLLDTISLEMSKQKLEYNESAEIIQEINSFLEDKLNILLGKTNTLTEVEDKALLLHQSINHIIDGLQYHYGDSKTLEYINIQQTKLNKEIGELNNL